MVGFCLVKVLLNIDMIYYLAYGVLAFIATLVHPFFFAFHLSEVVLRYPTLRNIIKSFWEPKVALGLTFILVLLMNYYFTLMAYLLFSDIYTNGIIIIIYRKMWFIISLFSFNIWLCI